MGPGPRAAAPCTSCCRPPCRSAAWRRSSASTGCSATTTWPPRARRRCCSATTRPMRSTCSARRKNPPSTPRTASTTGSSRATPSAVNPANSGTKAAVLVRPRPGRSGRDRRGAAAALPQGAGQDTFGPEFEQVFDDRKREADEFYATVIHPGLSDSDRHIARRAYAGLLWGKQLYRYNVDEWIEGDPTESPAPGFPQGGAAPEPALGPARPCRRDLHAGRVGVPLVRRLGSGLSRDPAGACRPGFRQGTAGADVPGMVDAPERPVAGLRMGVRRRQPAGARLGGLACLPDRRLPRPGIPDPGVHQAAAELLLVDQPQGRHGLEHLRGRLPRDGQHRPVQPVGETAARATGWNSPTPPAGWRSTASRCSRSRWSCPGTTRPGTRWPPSSWSTSCRSPRR